MQHGDGASARTCPFSGATASVATAGVASGDERKRLGRRGFLAGLAGLAAVPLVGGRGGTAAAAGSARKAAKAARRALKGSHGQELRGLRIAVRGGRAKEARFGLMFKQLPAYNTPDALLTKLAARMNDGKQPLSDVKDSDTAFDIAAIPAGYVYLGQFIDHDMTLDKTPLAQQKQDVDGMINYDTPRFDLGSVYGKGPTGSPELYDPARPGYLLVNEHDGLFDLPRDDVGAAFLGDPRNDENLIVAQLHTVFLRLHNKYRDQGKTFAAAQQLCRWHFQWLIVNDYLSRIVGADVVRSLLRRTGSGPIQFAGKYYKPKNPNKPYMPIEYSGAAFRFGHSMIRAEYEVQDGHTVPIFGPDGYEDLRGNRPIPHNLWIDWNYFFDIPGMDTPDDRNMARKIDTQISLPLAKLPSTVVAATAGAIVALSERNLLRGKRLGLPAGQDVATAMGIKPLSNAQLGLTEAGWKGKAPLWFYVLKEAELLGGQKLGPVGGRIVAEVILGLIALDNTSYFNANPSFNPGGSFTTGDLILMADAIDPRARIKNPDPEPDPDPVPVDDDEVGEPEAIEPLPGTID
ncbi:MAG: heme peroxidase [Propionibacteriaceae bacterium]|jgi:hypothetical protein|nr:heme peroxidase [Propionibacteriaceae bacterium]